MKNSNLLEKSKGVVFFAFDSVTTKYTDIAVQNARLVKQHLKLPVTLITDSNEDFNTTFDKIVKISYHENNFRSLTKDSIIEWKNLKRHTAYELSPYDETLLLDVDYLVLDNSFLQIFDSLEDYKLFYNAHTPNFKEMGAMGPNSLPFIWATAIFFKKTEKAKNLFFLVQRIEKNWNYYRKLYKISQVSYRNDYAFTIANLLLNGYKYDTRHSLHQSMLLIDEPIFELQHRDNNIVIRYNSKADVIVRQNIHILDKQFLTSNSFVKFVDKECCE